MELPAYRQATFQRPALKVLAAVGVVLLVALPLVTTIVLGDGAYQRRDYPGPVAGPGTAVLRALADLASWLTIGAATAALVLQPVRRNRGLPLRDDFDVRLIQLAAGAWALLSAGLVLFEATDANGVPLTHALHPASLMTLISASSFPKAWLLAGVLALAIAVYAPRIFQARQLLVVLLLGGVAAIAPVVVGSVLVGPDHDFANDAAVFHTMATAAVLGAVLAIALRLVNGMLLRPITLRRLALAGLVTMPVIVGSEVLIAWFKMAGSSLTDNLTGQLTLLRLGAFVLLWALAWALHRGLRRGTLDHERVMAGVLSAATLVLVALAVQVTMTRFLSPQYFVETSISEIFLGYNVPDAPTFAVFLSHWRIDVLFTGLAVIGIGCYLWGVHVLHRRGDPWPKGRSAAWLLGWASIVLVTSSGLGRYAAPDFSVHMGVHMILNMLAPVLLVLGGPMTLLLRANRPAKRGEPAGLREVVDAALHWPLMRALYHPLFIFALFIGSYYGLYLTGLFGFAARFHWAHQLMNLHFLVIGYLFYSLAIGVDRMPRQLPHIGKLGLTMAAMPFHAFFGVVIMTQTTIIAETFYRYLDLPWATNLADTQFVAGGIAWAGGEPVLLLVVLTLAVQWARSDEREARRKDRHLDTGLDEEFEAYNEMMKRLAQRDEAAAASRPTPGDAPSSPPVAHTGSISDGQATSRNGERR